MPKKEEDIARYGLYRYDEWKDLILRRIFDDFSFRYFKVAIGKGLLTRDRLLGYLAYPQHLLDAKEAAVTDAEPALRRRAGTSWFGNDI